MEHDTVPVKLHNVDCPHRLHSMRCQSINCTTYVAQPRLNSPGGTTYDAPHTLHQINCSTEVAQRIVHQAQEPGQTRGC
eukprot:8827468-Pyramimonas_sp.AAC.1